MSEETRATDSIPAYMKGKVVAIFGFEEDGLDQAKHLRNIGVQVIVSLRQGSSDDIWKQENFEILSIWDAAKQADIFQVW